MSTMPKLVGRSAEFRHAVALLERCAGFDIPVLISGETGTGKELAARAIHYMSQRRGAPFVPVNCGALPETLVESELFGCERGAYTDARHGRDGLVGAAESGTLFLDEVDALSAHAQCALLRFMQDQTYRPLGSNHDRKGNVRIVAAASQRMQAMIRDGSFRADLAYRLDVLALELPPLRKREGDARLLAGHFASAFAKRYQLSERPIAAESLDWLERHDWPGNVRELENLVHRQTLLCTDGQIRLPHPGAAAPTDAAPLRYHEARTATLLSWERDYLRALLRQAQGNVTHAAELAGKERRCLGKLLKKHGIDREQFTLHSA